MGHIEHVVGLGWGVGGILSMVWGWGGVWGAY